MELDIPVRGDNRGWFKLGKLPKRENGFSLYFPGFLHKLQNNISFSRKNVLCGLHAEPWDKYIL